jgi:hypothetical protein
MMLWWQACRLHPKEFAAVTAAATEKPVGLLKNAGVEVICFRVAHASSASGDGVTPSRTFLGRLFRRDAETRHAGRVRYPDEEIPIRNPNPIRNPSD